MKRIFAVVTMLFIVASLHAQQVPVQEYILDNGFRLLMVPRKGDPNIAAGWIARVGSVNERPGITGVSHLFEHMMFKGTHTIGTTNIKEDLEIIERMDAVKVEARKLEQEQIRRLRLGEISDLKDPKNRTPRLQELLEEFTRLSEAQEKLLVKNEFDKIYTAAGASGMNAGTSHDFTIYYINVPANKLELWFWMESDRLLNPVFREFYSERDVVFEERRLSTESTPTGRFNEQYDALFWISSPYHWPVIGWPSDLDGLTREEALDYFAINYAPNNLTACLIGDFDPNNAKELADLYFSRLKRNPKPQPPVRTREIEQMAETRMIAFAETNPRVRIRYHSVADGHRDEPTLVVLGSLLSGRTGRLYKSLVLDHKIANSASAGQSGFKYEGFFELNGVAKPPHTPEQVEQALYNEIEKIQQERVGDRELQKIKNQFAAGNFRRLRNNFALMFQLLVADGNRGWRTFNEDPKKLDAVTAEDVQRVANKYFKTGNRTVALYYTKKSAGGEGDPLLTGLTDEQKTRVRQFKGMLGQLPLDRAKVMLQQMEQREEEAPEEQKKVLEVFRKLLREKIEKSEP